MTLKPRVSGRERVRRVLLLIGWNAAFTVMGLTLIVVVGEIYFRAKMPFMHRSQPWYFDPEVGVTLKPNAENIYTNNLDFWTVSYTNSLGFLDREPQLTITSDSCHVVVVGDSFVNAREVDISDKLQVKLEELAAQTLPHLNVTTSAFGRTATGQINQLPYYDKYARVMDPKLVVLVFHHNDFWDNSPLLSAMIQGYYPERSPFVTALKDKDGTMELRPPDPEYLQWSVPAVPLSWLQTWLSNAAEVSRFAKWIEAKTSNDAFISDHDWMVGLRERLKELPAYETLPLEWWPSNKTEAFELLNEDNLPLFYEENMDFTEFALDEFKRRADRDDAALVILSTHHVGAEGDPAFDRLKAMAEARGIPVISQLDYILRSGRRVEDAHFRHDPHWTIAGHRWAAEALLQYLAQNQRICDSRGAERG